MSRTRWQVGLALGVAIAAGSWGPSASAAMPGDSNASRCTPSILALPLPVGMNHGDVLAVGGQLAVGFVADSSNAQHAAEWIRSGGGWTVRDLGDFGVPAGQPLSATGVDARGEVAVGVNFDVMGGWLVSGSVVHQLKDFAGGTNAYVRAINASGEMAGEALDADGNDFAAVWAHWWTAPVKLAPVAGYDGSYAQGLNDEGVVVGGSFSFGAPPTLATRWARNGTPITLGSTTGDAEAANINNHGLVVGRGLAGTRTARVWTRPAAYTDLGLFSGTQFSQALGVNENGVVVGFEGANPAGEIPVRHLLYWPGTGPSMSLLPLSLHWSDGALSHVIANDGTVYGSSSATPTSFPQPTAWICAAAQAFVPTPQGPAQGYHPPVVRFLS